MRPTRPTILVPASLAVVLFAGPGCNNGNGMSRSFQAVIDDAVTIHRIPGVVAGIATSEDIWLGAAGAADLATGQAMTTDMQVHIASLTKPLVATMIMKLAEQGVISLNDTITRWLPDAQLKNQDRITVRMLLSHTGGVYDHENAPEFTEASAADPHHEWTWPEIRQILSLHEPDFEPGMGFRYSNTGFYLLGMIAESATGDTVEHLTKALVFDPAGSTRTAITRAGAKTAPFAHDYAVLEDGGAPVDITDWNLSWDWTAGSAVTTAADILAWSRALFAGGILNPLSLIEMTTPVSPAAYYALGVMAIDGDPYMGGRSVSHGGSNAGYVSIWYHYPGRHWTIFFAINRNDTAHAADGVDVSAAQAAILEGFTNIFKRL